MIEIGGPAVVEYRVTVVTLGFGFASAASIAGKCEVHLAKMATDGWRLVHADRNSLAIPAYWTYIWERPAAPVASTRHAETNAVVRP